VGKMIHCVLTRASEKWYKLSAEYFTISYQGAFQSLSMLYPEST